MLFLSDEGKLFERYPESTLSVREALVTESYQTQDREAPLVLEDDPVPRVRRLTLNRPKKRNALSNPTEVFEEP